REFGIRLALGSQPQLLLKGVIADGAVMAGAGLLAGAAFGFVLARLAGHYFPDVKMPGVLPVVLSAFVLLAAAVVASWLPAAGAVHFFNKRAHVRHRDMWIESAVADKYLCLNRPWLSRPRCVQTSVYANHS